MGVRGGRGGWKTDVVPVCHDAAEIVRSSRLCVDAACCYEAAPVRRNVVARCPLELFDRCPPCLFRNSVGLPTVWRNEKKC